jgi:light-regulated signal transduction histidine kinase (bacteriophytochrome)
LPLIEADSIQVLGVPLNLSMNAIEMLKHAVQESRLLTIATSVNNDAVSVSVRHSAPNIAVGCAPPRVAQKIVESHGGRLWVNTAPEGITCAFAIPIFAER